MGGGALQFAVQLPWILRLERGLAIRWDTRRQEVREAVRNAGPAMDLRRTPSIWNYARNAGYRTVLTGKIEIGQGIVTTLAQIAAEELDVSLVRVRMASICGS